MKEYLRQLAAQADNDLARACLVREYLQARVLESLQDPGVFLRWAFVGGTALRFLFSIPRFSEDLDFSLIKPGEDAGFRTALTEVKRALSLEGYRIEINVNDQKTVASAWVRFPGLPHELGLSPHRSQTLSIKVEVDTRPPPGAGIATSVVRRHVTLQPMPLRQGVPAGGETARRPEPALDQGPRPLRPRLVSGGPHLAGAEPGLAQCRLGADRMEGARHDGRQLAGRGSSTDRSPGLGTRAGGCSAIPGAGTRYRHGDRGIPQQFVGRRRPVAGRHGGSTMNAKRVTVGIPPSKLYLFMSSPPPHRCCLAARRAAFFCCSDASTLLDELR